MTNAVATLFNHEWLREVTAGELAAEFGVAKTRVLEHFRRTESKLLASD
jgi:predicted DNA binding protein